MQRRIAEAVAPVIERVRQETSDGADTEPDEPRDDTGTDDRESAANESGSIKEDGEQEQEPATTKRRSTRNQEKSSEGDEDGPNLASAATSLLSAIPQALQTHGDHTLDSILESVLDVIFSDQFRKSLQRQRQDFVDLVLETALATIQDIDTQRELRREIEGELHDVFEASIDAIFSGRVRRHLSVNLQQAIDAALEGNIGLAVREVGEALTRVVEEILDVLEDYWLQVLQITMSVAFQALRETVTSAIAEGTGSNFEEAKEKLEDSGDDLRDKLEDAAKKLRDNIEDAQHDMKENIKEGFQSAFPGADGGEKQLGRRPATRPPSARPPSGRPPSGRPPSGRPPSAKW